MEKKLIFWSDKYSVGFDKIDNEHKKLIELINKLFDAFLNARANDVVESIIIEMKKYTELHFKTEEKYFEKYNYSNTEAHKKRHQDFVDKVTDFHNYYKTGSLAITYNIMNFLRDWLTEHIQGDDKKYAAEFKSKNLDII